MEKADHIAAFARHVQAHKVAFYERLGLTLVMGRREGIAFWDEDGRRYINCHANGGVFNLGHRHPDVWAEVTRAAETYDIGNHHFVSTPRAMLAAELVASFGEDSGGEPLDKVVFGVSGGEAVDLALKIARGYTGRREILSIEGAYHGHTGLAVAAGSRAFADVFNLPTDGFTHLPLADLARIETHFGDDTAALILETVPATLGMPVIPSEVMRHVREQCTRHGVVFILDEVQTGLGRTGRPWGFQHYDIVPDMVVIGKGLSGGWMPISATAFRARFDTIFARNPFAHVSTAGGSEIACLAARKVLEISTDPAFLDHVLGLSRFFRSFFDDALPRSSYARELRQLGLFMGVVFSEPAACLACMKLLADHGVFTLFAANDPRVLQFLPPLITSLPEARDIAARVSASLEALETENLEALRPFLSTLLG